MTLSERSDSKKICPQCENELVWRPYRPYPVLTQALFAVSFGLFLIFNAKIQTQRVLLWGWCAVQVALGSLLVYQRLQSRRRVLRCIRCDSELR